MRKNAAPKRPVVKDPVYNSEQVTQLVNKVLQDGKKSTAERIVYGALEACREKTGTDPVGTLEKALGNIRPDLEVRSRRVGGATYQVPVEVKPGRANTLALRWLVTFTRQRRERAWSSASPTRSWTPPTASALPSSAVRIPTRWRKPTALSLTTAGNYTPRCLATAGSSALSNVARTHTTDNFTVGIEKRIACSRGSSTHSPRSASSRALSEEFPKSVRAGFCARWPRAICVRESLVTRGAKQ